MNKKRLYGIVLGLITLGGFGIALYMGGFSSTGSVTATAGSEPSAVTCSEDFSITSDGNTTVECEYDNTDGTINLELVCDTSNITSTDSKCNYENGKDLKMWVGIDGSDFSPCESTPTKEMTSGLHNISLRLEAHPNRCPLNGSYDVTGTIV